VSWPGQTPNSNLFIIESATAMRYCSAFTSIGLGDCAVCLKIASHMSIEVQQEIAGAASQNSWTKHLLVALECRLDAKLRCAPPPACIRGLGACSAAADAARAHAHGPTYCGASSSGSRSKKPESGRQHPDARCRTSARCQHACGCETFGCRQCEPSEVRSRQPALVRLERRGGLDRDAARWHGGQRLPPRRVSACLLAAHGLKHVTAGLPVGLMRPLTKLVAVLELQPGAAGTRTYAQHRHRRPISHRHGC